MTRSLQRRSGPAPLDLIEAAVHLLRGAGPGTWLAYSIGTVPFVLALLYFWTDMSRGAFADRRCLFSALGLAWLFVWMRTWQAVFAVKLREQLSQQPASGWSWRRWFRVAQIQAAIQPTAFLLLPLSTILAPWAFAFYHNASVLADQGNGSIGATFSKAARQARIWSGTNLVVLLALSGFAFVIFLNFMLTILVLPSLLKMLLAVESVFTFSGWAVLNTTLLAVAAALTYLALDPLVRAVYVLRCYHGESRTTGEDLRMELRSFTVVPRAAAMALCLLLMLGTSASLRAAEPPTENPSVPAGNITELDQALDRVLKRTEYNWRQPRERSPETQSEDGWLAQRLKEFQTAIKNSVIWLRDKAEAAIDWLERIFRPKSSLPTGSLNPLAWMSGVQVLVFLLLAIVLSVLAVLLLRAWRNRVRRDVVNAEAVVLVPDLRDENVGADQLPEDGWLRLAREMMGQGELLLAMRALYLASLAHLAHRELVKLEKFKSNRDYEREVRRRGRAIQGLPEAFADNVTAFDRAWYGLHEVTREALGRFEENFQRIKTE